MAFRAMGENINFENIILMDIFEFWIDLDCKKIKKNLFKKFTLSKKS